LSWLADLDARANRCWLPVRILYLAIRWYLILGGVIIAVGLAFQGNPLGIGITAFVVAAVVSGVTAGLTARGAKR
jgi:hypothetical protein